MVVLGLGFAACALTWASLGSDGVVPGNGKSVAEVAAISSILVVIAGTVIARIRGVQIGLRIQGLG